MDKATQILEDQQATDDDERYVVPWEDSIYTHRANRSLNYFFRTLLNCERKVKE